VDVPGTDYRTANVMILPFAYMTARLV
jgi:hypothetical protein